MVIITTINIHEIKSITLSEVNDLKTGCFSRDIIIRHYTNYRRENIEQIRINLFSYERNALKNIDVKGLTEETFTFEIEEEEEF